jgi:NAD(P)-dependent dehydrogenase (short-subunit alcohol dehydrogenase family)
MMNGGVIIVTGASRGIGAAIAECLAEAGNHVGCISRSGAHPDRPSASESARSRWTTAAADVTDAAALSRAFVTVAAGRRIVGLVNCAGLHTEGRSAEIAIEQWNDLLATNATSVVIACQAAYPSLSQGGGLIVNIGSFFDKLGVKRNLAYCASKAAVGAITRVLAVEWAQHGIRVLNVAPGYIVTDLNRAVMAGPLGAYLEKRIPAGQPGTAEDVGKLVAGLFSMQSPFLTGETLYIDGAQGIAH